MNPITPKLDCQKVRKLIQPYIEEGREGKRIPGMATHLEACHECRLEHTFALSLIGAFSTLEDIDPIPDFTARVMHRARRESKLRKLWILAGFGALVSAFAGLAALVAATVGLNGIWALKKIPAGLSWLAEQALDLLIYVPKLLSIAGTVVSAIPQMEFAPSVLWSVALFMAALMAAEVMGARALNKSAVGARA